MQFFLKYQTVLLRTLGALFILIAIMAQFWSTPSKKLTANEIAAANLARIEASVSGTSKSTAGKKKPDTSHFISKLKKQREKQLRYLTIVLMIFGVGALGYTFIKRDETPS